MNKHIVITGGAGFIGSHFVRHIKAKYPDYKITAIDKLTYAGNESNVPKGIKLIVDDINSQEFIGDIEDANFLVHFAAESHVTRSEKDPGIFERTNVAGTKNLLEIAKELTNLERFVHISTDEVYGDAEDGRFFTEDEKEIGDHQATSEYAKSKSRADDVARKYMKELPVNIVRPTNNFGPRQYPEKALPRFITKVVRGEPIPLWGVGNQIRDWLYAPDTAKAVDLILHEAPKGEAYNIGANNEPEIKNRDLAHWLMGRLHDYGAVIEHELDKREHHDFRYSVDTAKIKELGWQPSDNPWSQFEETIQWYLNNEDWWKPLIEEAESIY